MIDPIAAALLAELESRPTAARVREITHSLSAILACANAERDDALRRVTMLRDSLYEATAYSR